MHVTEPITKDPIKRGGVNNCKEDDNNYNQDSDKRYSNRYQYNSDSVQMFDSIGIIKPEASQKRALAGIGKATKKKYEGCSREDDTMKFMCRTTRSRGQLVLPAMEMVRILEAAMVEN